MANRTVYTKLFLLLALCCWSVQSIVAQSVVVRADVDSPSVVIGKPVNITVQLSQPSSIKIDWNEIDSLDQLEILSRSAVDTVKTTDPAILLRKQVYTVTAYDSGSFKVPGFAFKYKAPGIDREQFAISDSLLISFNLVPVDTTKAIKDIRPVVDVPFDWTMVILLSAGVVLLLIITWYLVQRWKRKRAGKEVAGPAIVKLPAEVIAMNALRQLDDEKRWQSGNLKGYYTGLTDILRVYISDRWGVNAMEMTSDEILENGFIQVVNQEQVQPLAILLRTSDLVKFAKATPLAYENEHSMKTAVDFVQKTTPVVVATTQGAAQQQEVKP